MDLLNRFLYLLVILLLLQLSSTIATKKSYIVYLGEHLHGPELSSVDLNQVTRSHRQFLGSFLGSDKPEDAIFYSYERHINGFAAHLDEAVAAKLAKHPKVVSVFLNQGRKLHITHSWEFLGLEDDGKIPSNSIWKKAGYGEDTIIGILDTGVWPESESFSDEGLGPIPSKWKGICQNHNNAIFKCNRKLIGERYFNKGYEAAVGPLNFSYVSPCDKEGNGSHTLSTAGGILAAKASVSVLGKGTAKEGSPKARVAVYQVCWPSVAGIECYDADIMAAFDMAIHDGVDVLSVSLGRDQSTLLNDSIAIGSFHAAKHGIMVVSSAGDSGPGDHSVSNVAPWLITAAASTTDADFPRYVVLGNKKHLKGQSLSDEALPNKKFFPLIIAAEAKAPNVSTEDVVLRQNGTLDPKKVKEKILLRPRGINASIDEVDEALLAGAVGRPSLRHLLFLEQEVVDPNGAMDPGLLRDLLEFVKKLRQVLKSVAVVVKKAAVLLEAVDMVLIAVLFLN